MDRIWTQRNVPYRACLVSLLIGILPFVIGFAAPDWLWFSMRINGTAVDGKYGLWELCHVSRDRQCFSNPVTGNTIAGGWFLTVVVFQSVALPFYISALIMASLQNFAPRRWLATLRLQKLRELLHKDSETPEDMAFIAGFLSFLSIIVFMIMTSDDVSDGAYYSWGFAMSFTGASIPVITGVLMCKTHTPAFSPPARPAEPRVVHTLPPTAHRRTARQPSRQSDRPGERRAGRSADRHASRRVDQRYRR